MNTLTTNQKVLALLAILLSVAYGISLATSGVSTPGCNDW
jgi:hypothetical protein